MSILMSEKKNEDLKNSLKSSEEEVTVYESVDSTENYVLL